MKTDEQLDQALSRLPREIAPPQDLWAGIEAQLVPRQPSLRWWQQQPVQRWAAVFALALVGVLWWNQSPDTTPLPSDSIALQPGVDNSEQVLIAPEQQIIASYEQVKAQQLGELGMVSPDVGDWRYQMAVWDQAITQVQGALTYYPDEPFLLAQMQGLYQQQLEYLQLISALDADYDVWMENQP